VAAHSRVLVELEAGWTRNPRRSGSASCLIKGASARPFPSHGKLDISWDPRHRLERRLAPPINLASCAHASRTQSSSPVRGHCYFTLSRTSRATAVPTRNRTAWWRGGNSPDLLVEYQAVRSFHRQATCKTARIAAAAAASCTCGTRSDKQNKSHFNGIVFLLPRLKNCRVSVKLFTSLGGSARPSSPFRWLDLFSPSLLIAKDPCTQA
jgi:hypothetical protein